MSSNPSFFQPIKDPEVINSLQNKIGMAADRYLSWSSRSFVWKKETSHWQKDPVKKTKDFDKVLKVIIGIASLGFVPLSALIIKTVYRRSLFERIKKQNDTKVQKNDLFNKTVKTDAKAKKETDKTDPFSVKNQELLSSKSKESENNLLKEVNRFKPDAVNGNVDAMFKLGLAYSNLYKVVNEDNLAIEYRKEAINWLKSAVDQGHTNAIYELAAIYNVTEGTIGDTREAIKWYKLAAQKGNVDAMFELGKIYSAEFGSEKDIHEAIKWFKLAAEHGNVEAMFELGLIYDDEDLNEFEDKAQAFIWFKKAANQGHAEAMFELGYLYDEGYPTKINKQKAFKWYKKAADAGNSDAMANLGIMFDTGDGVKKNKKKAAKWFLRSAELGNDSSMHSLGSCYFIGDGVNKDIEAAKKWFMKASQAENYFALNDLGLALAFDASEENNALAAEKFFIAAENKVPEANLNVAIIRRIGFGVSKNVDLSNKIFQNLNKDIAKNYLEHLEDIASDNPNNSNMNLFAGVGYLLNASPKEAKNWLRKSANLGNRYASELLEELEKNL